METTKFSSTLFICSEQWLTPDYLVLGRTVGSEENGTENVIIIGVHCATRTQLPAKMLETIANLQVEAEKANNYDAYFAKMKEFFELQRNRLMRSNVGPMVIPENLIPIASQVSNGAQVSEDQLVYLHENVELPI